MLVPTHCDIYETSSLDYETEFVAIFITLDGLDHTISRLVVHLVILCPVVLAGKHLCLCLLCQLRRLDSVEQSLISILLLHISEVWVT